MIIAQMILLGIYLIHNLHFLVNLGLIFSILAVLGKEKARSDLVKVA